MALSQFTYKTDCYSTESERPHHCCLLANNFGSCQVFLIPHNGPEDAPKLPFTVGGGSGPASWLVQPAILVQLTVVTNRHTQTDRPRYHACNAAWQQQAGCQKSTDTNNIITTISVLSLTTQNDSHNTGRSILRSCRGIFHKVKGSSP